MPDGSSSSGSSGAVSGVFEVRSLTAAVGANAAAGVLRGAEKLATIHTMTDPKELPPESEDDALNDVEALGGDDEIMESLPPEGSPISVDTDGTSFNAISGKNIAKAGIVASVGVSF